MSAQDVGVIIGALLEVGKHSSVREPSGLGQSQIADVSDEEQLIAQGEEWLPRFWDAYDALEE